MAVYIALLRGINVLGRHALPMRDLQRLFEAEGCRTVRTYIQSGNVVFRSPAVVARRLPPRVTALVARQWGFEPRVLVIAATALRRAVARNPFPAAVSRPTSLHAFFLPRPPVNPDLTSMEATRAESERYALDGSVLYLHTPDGFGPSKLAGRVERLLGVDATARNWRTVTALLEMADGLGTSRQGPAPGAGRARRR